MAYKYKYGDRPLDDFTIQRGVGRGGFGEVYYAISDGGREVGLKYLHNNPDMELRGVSHCMNLKSPHLVTIFDVKKSTDDEYFIIMEYVSGPSLRDLLIAEPDGLGPQKAAYFVREIAKGLGYLHDRGIVHRDMKPGNVFYDEGYVKIGDYGLSKAMSVSRHSAQTASVGTVHYMAPEVGSGNYSRSIDIYALGVMLYEMLLGKVPFEGASLGEVLMKHLTEQPEVQSLPAPFAQVIRKALEKDPKDRYQSVNEMVDDLLEVDDVRQSVAGFNPTSLSAAARHVAHNQADSPMPSPNPLRPTESILPAIPVSPAAGKAHEWVAPQRGSGVGHRLKKRFDQIDSKIEKKLDKLAGGRRHRRAAEQAQQPVSPGDFPPQKAPIQGKERFRRIVLAVVMAVGLATGAGISVGSYASAKADPVWMGALGGLCAMLQTLGICIGVMGSRWLGAAGPGGANPRWVTSIILLGCCLPLLFLATLPIFADGSEDAGLAVLAALLIATILIPWDKQIRNGAEGDLSIGSAIFAGFAAFIIAKIFEAEEFAFMAAAAAGASALSVQAIAWAWPEFSFAHLRPVTESSTRASRREAKKGDPSKKNNWALGLEAAEASLTAVAEEAGAAVTMAAFGAKTAKAYASPGMVENPEDIPEGIPVGQRVKGASMGSNAPLARARSSIGRAFFSLLAFLLAGGMIATFVLVILKSSNHVPGGSDAALRMHYSDIMALTCGCIACFSWLVFALRKTTLRKRNGFWQETVKPFLMAASMNVAGSMITMLSMPDSAEIFGSHGDGRDPAVVALIFGSLLFVILLVTPAKRQRPKFVVLPSASAPLRDQAPVTDDADRPREYAQASDSPAEDPDV